MLLSAASAQQEQNGSASVALFALPGLHAYHARHYSARYRRSLHQNVFRCPDWVMHVLAVALSSYVSGLDDRCGVCNFFFGKVWWRREGLYLVVIATWRACSMLEA